MVNENSSSASFKRNTVINFIGYGIYMGFQWLINIAVVRMMGYESAGVLSLAITVTSSFYVVAHFNVRTYQVSDYKNKFSAGEYVGQRLVNCGAAMLFCVIYSLICGYSGEKLMCIIVYMLFKLTESFLDVLHGILQKNYRLDTIGYSFAIRGVITFVSFALGVWLAQSIVVASGLMFLTSFAMLFCYEFPYASKNASLKPVFRLKSMMQIYKASLLVFAYYFIFNILTIMPRSLLEYYHGSETLGVFNSVASPVFIVQLSATLILSPVVNVFTEAYAAGDKKKFNRAYVISASAILAICLIWLFAAYLFGDALLRLLIGESIAPYTYIFIPLMISTAFLVLSSLESGILTVIRDMKGLILSACMGLAACTVSSLLFIPKYGLDGITAVMIISFAFMAVATFIYTIIKLHFVFKGAGHDKS